MKDRYHRVRVGGIDGNGRIKLRVVGGGGNHVHITCRTGQRFRIGRIPTDHVDEHVFAVVAGGKALEQVVSGTAHQRVGPATTHQDVVAGAAAEGVIAGAAVEEVVVVLAIHCVGAVPAEHLVLTGSAKHRVGTIVTAERVAAAITSQRVVAGPALDGITSRVAADVVVLGPAVQDVVTGAAVNLISVASAPDHVGARLAPQRIVAKPAYDRILISAAVDVVPKRSVHRPGNVAADDAIGSLAAIDVYNSKLRIGGIGEGLDGDDIHTNIAGNAQFLQLVSSCRNRVITGEEQRIIADILDDVWINDDRIQRVARILARQHLNHTGVCVHSDFDIVVCFVAAGVFVVRSDLQSFHDISVVKVGRVPDDDAQQRPVFEHFHLRCERFRPLFTP